MNLESKLRDRNLKWNWDKIAAFVIENPQHLKKLVEFALKGEKIIRQNACAVLGKITDKDKIIASPYYGTIIQHLATNPIDAFKRNTLRIFQTCDIPEEQEGFLFDTSLKYLKSLEEPIAVKAFSMTSARRIAEKYPELAEELLHQIEILVEEKVSAGITARGNRESKILRKLIEAN